MTPEQFDESITMLRSTDPMTYEDGYHSLQGDNLIRYAPQIVGHLQSEVDPEMRAKLVELIGDADLPEHIPLLVSRTVSPKPRSAILGVQSTLTFKTRICQS